MAYVCHHAKQPEPAVRLKCPQTCQSIHVIIDPAKKTRRLQPRPLRLVYSLWTALNAKTTSYFEHDLSLELVQVRPCTMAVMTQRVNIHGIICFEVRVDPHVPAWLSQAQHISILSNLYSLSSDSPQSARYSTTLKLLKDSITPLCDSSVQFCISVQGNENRQSPHPCLEPTLHESPHGSS